MRNETTDFVEGEFAYVTDGRSNLQRVKIVKIASRNTRGGVRITITTSGGATYDGDGQPRPRQAWSTLMLRRADAELDSKYRRARCGSWRTCCKSW